MDCHVFREEAAKVEFWKAHFAKLDAGVQEAQGEEEEEEKKKADLLKFEAPDVSNASKRKKFCRLGHWGRRHLACPSADE